MDMDKVNMREIENKRKNVRIGFLVVGVLVLITVSYLRVSGETPQTSIVAKGLMAAIGVTLFATALPAFAVKCPRCKRPFHKSPVHVIFPSKKCWNCGYPCL